MLILHLLLINHGFLIDTRLFQVKTYDLVIYGRDFQFRADLAAENVQYLAFVPANQRVFLKPPKIGLPRQPGDHKGRFFSRERVLNRVQPL